MLPYDYYSLKPFLPRNNVGNGQCVEQHHCDQGPADVVPAERLNLVLRHVFELSKGRGQQGGGQAEDVHCLGVSIDIAYCHVDVGKVTLRRVEEEFCGVFDVVEELGHAYESACTKRGAGDPFERCGAFDLKEAGS